MIRRSARRRIALQEPDLKSSLKHAARFSRTPNCVRSDPIAINFDPEDVIGKIRPNEIGIMNKTSFSGAMLLAGVLIAGSATVSFASAQDYEFQPVSTDVKQGRGSLVSVRLVDKRTGKPVADAVIFTTRMDMAPEGMEMMTAPVEAATSTEPGVYVFKTDFAMAGSWRFKLAAKVQGEPDTVQGELVLKANP